MPKIWKTGDRIPISHVNELEVKAEAHDKLVAEQRRVRKPLKETEEMKSE